MSPLKSGQQPGGVRVLLFAIAAGTMFVSVAQITFTHLYATHLVVVKNHLETFGAKRLGSIDYKTGPNRYMKVEGIEPNI